MWVSQKQGAFLGVLYWGPSFSGNYHIGDQIGNYYGAMKGDTRSLDYSSYSSLPIWIPIHDNPYLGDPLKGIHNFGSSVQFKKPSHGGGMPKWLSS